MAIGSVLGGLGSTLLGGVMSKGSGSSSRAKSEIRDFRSSNGLFDTDKDKVGKTNKMTSQATGDMLDYQNQQLSHAGLFGDMAVNNATADMAGQMGQDFLGNLGAYDPMQIAQMQFDQFNPILQDQNNQDFLDMENRLFAQGRLDQNGVGGGNGQMNALFDAQQDGQRKLLFDSFGQGLAAQNQQFNLGSSLAQLDPQLRGLFQSLGTQGMNNVLSIDQQGLNRYSAFAGGSQGSQAASTPGFNPVGAIGAGLLNSGANGLTNAMNGLFQPQTTGGAYGGYSPNAPSMFSGNPYA